MGTKTACEQWGDNLIHSFSHRCRRSSGFCCPLQQEGWHCSVNARRLWKRRSICSRATENGPAFREWFVCTQQSAGPLAPPTFGRCFNRCQQASHVHGQIWWCAHPLLCSVYRLSPAPLSLSPLRPSAPSSLTLRQWLEQVNWRSSLTNIVSHQILSPAGHQLPAVQYMSCFHLLLAKLTCACLSAH